MLVRLLLLMLMLLLLLTHREHLRRVECIRVALIHHGASVGGCRSWDVTYRRLLLNLLLVVVGGGIVAVQPRFLAFEC